MTGALGDIQYLGERNVLCVQVQGYHLSFLWEIKSLENIGESDDDAMMLPTSVSRTQEPTETQSSRAPAL